MESKTETGLQFKSCQVCRRDWTGRDQFLSDPEIELIGYQVHFRDLEQGLFIFHHICGTSLAIPAGKFKNLYQGPIFKKNCHGSPDCPDYCLREDELRSCPVECECGWVRVIIQIIRKWPKKQRRV